MKTLSLLLLLFAAHWLPAQDVKWNEGSVVLASGDVITGQVSMMAGRNVVLVKRSDVESSLQKGVTSIERRGADVLAAHKVQSVFYYDKQANINRRFIARGSEYSVPVIQLYEVVLQGSIDVLRRPRSLSNSPDDGDFDYYVSNAGVIAPLWKFYKEVFPGLDDISRQHLTAFIKANGLRHADEANLIRVIGYYNQLIRSGETVARY
ncbi:MAG: hypothetical protein QM762_12085 [Chryseolinea sp.]